MPDQLDYLVRQLADLQARLADLERSDPLSATGYPALSGLTTGQPLRATSATAAAFGALDLTNANAVTGALPHGKGGTGLSATPTNGQLPIGNGSGYALATLTGTANQVTVTNGAGTITLSTPQDIHTGASPTFASLTLSATATALTAAGSATFGTADSSSGPITSNVRDSGTNTYLDVLTLNRYTSGTAAAALGSLIKTQLEDDGGTLQKALQIGTQWATAASASRKARAIFFIEDTGTREAFRIEASGSAPMIGFLGANAVARPTAYTQTYATATRTHSNITATAPSAYAGGANGYSTAAKAQEVRNAAAALVTDMANVKQVLNSVIDDLQGYGLCA